jgi:hypothetical protein
MQNRARISNLPSKLVRLWKPTATHKEYSDIKVETVKIYAYEYIW